MANTLLQTFIEGKESGPILLFVHGWPDDHTVWDLQVAHLKDRFRCVTTDLPGYSVDSSSPASSKWGYSFDDVVARLEKTIEAVGAGKPVILVAHDWGCLYAYMLEKKRPDLVLRMVALDIGGAFNLWPSLSTFGIATYQTYLMFAFLIGGPIGTWMARAFAHLVGAPSASTVARASVCYPYSHFWKAQIATCMGMGPYTPRCPVMFMYGCAGVKRIMTFHADWWANRIKNKKGSSVVEIPDASHWLMLEHPDVVNRHLDAFFAESEQAPAR